MTLGDFQSLVISFLFSLTAIVIIFGSVLFHEIAHLIMANLLGYTSNEIVLFPLGGLTKIRESMKSPKDEFLISVIGPISNFILAGIIYGFIFLEIFNNIVIYGVSINLILSIIAQFNILIGIFNLFIPVLPLDGGRTFKAIFTFFFDFKTAMKLTTAVSLFFAFILMILGLFFDPFLLFIGVIAIFSSYYIPKFSEIEYNFNKHNLGQEIHDLTLTVPYNMNLFYVYEKMNLEQQSHYLVIDDLNRFQGIVLKDDIKKYDQIYWLTTTANQIMRTKIKFQ